MALFEAVPVEKAKGFWDLYPCKNRHSLRPVGSREYFDEVEARKYFVEPQIPRFGKFERWKGKKALEIGCGIGTAAINFTRYGAHVAAVELSKKSMEIVKQQAKVYGFQDLIRWHHPSHAASGTGRRFRYATMCNLVARSRSWFTTTICGGSSRSC